MNNISTSTIETLNNFSMAQNYFSDILNAQLVIFSLVVGALIALYFLFNYKISKNQIESEVSEHMIKIKKELHNDIEQKYKIATDNLASELVKHENMMDVLRGEVYRTLGQFWGKEKSYSTAFIWWMRAASNFALAGDEKLARISLDSAYKSVKSIPYKHELNTELIGEYQIILKDINSVIYRIEKELLDEEVKKALNRELKYTVPTQDK